MTRLFEDALETVRKAPPEMQDAVALLMLDMVDDGALDPVPPEHLAAVLEGEMQADWGEFASDAGWPTPSIASAREGPAHPPCPRRPR